MNIKLTELLENFLTKKLSILPMSYDSVLEHKDRLNHDLEFLNEQLVSAKPFYISDITGILHCKDVILDHCKLPFPVTYFEGFMPAMTIHPEEYNEGLERLGISDKSSLSEPFFAPKSRVGLLCFDCEKFGGIEDPCPEFDAKLVPLYHVFVFTKYDDESTWTLLACHYTMCYVEEEQVVIPLPVGKPYGDFREESLFDFSMRNKQLASVTIDLLQILHCENVSTVVKKPSEKLNKKRRKRGKIPHVSYRMLSLNKSSSSKASSTLDGSKRSSPRQHWVRGHMRNVNTKLGTVRRFIAPFLKGDANKGKVFKEYQLFNQE